MKKVLLINGPNLQLLGRREQYDDSTLRDYAARSARNKNIKNCAVHFEEADLYEVLSRSVGGR